MSDVKYFHIKNAAQQVEGVRFEGYCNFAGQMRGILATEDKDLITKIKAKGKGSGIEEITLEEYERCLKKKSALGLGSYRQPLVPVPTVSPTTMKGEGRGVVVESTPKLDQRVAETKIEKVADVVVVDTVEPVETKPKTTKKKNS